MRILTRCQVIEAAAEAMHRLNDRAPWTYLTETEREHYRVLARTTLDIAERNRL